MNLKEIDPWENWELLTLEDDTYVHILGTDIFVPVSNYMDTDEAHATAVCLFEAEYKQKE